MLIACQCTIFVTYRQSYAFHFASAGILFISLPIVCVAQMCSTKCDCHIVTCGGLSLLGFIALALSPITSTHIERIDRRPSLVIGEWILLFTIAFIIYGNYVRHTYSKCKSRICNTNGICCASPIRRLHLVYRAETNI